MYQPLDSRAGQTFSMVFELSIIFHKVVSLMAILKFSYAAMIPRGELQFGLPAGLGGLGLNISKCLIFQFLSRKIKTA